MPQIYTIFLTRIKPLSCDKKSGSSSERKSVQSAACLWRQQWVYGISVTISRSAAASTKGLRATDPWVFLSLCEKMTEENRTATNAWLSKAQKETNKRPIKKREWGNRWRVKRCENHKRRKKTRGERSWRAEAGDESEGWRETGGKFCCQQRVGGRWWKDNDRGRGLLDLCWPLAGADCWEGLKEMGAAAVLTWWDILPPAR